MYQNIKDYFFNHIKNSLQDPSAKAAKFVAFGDEISSGICKEILKGNLDYIGGSAELAKKLYTIISNDERINPCDLAVCLYHNENGNGSNLTKYLALLKIDPTAVFRHKTIVDEQGKKYVSFEIEEEVMPTTREKLQKCAFIQPMEPRPEYDMIILDKEVRDVSDFFLKDFLGASLAFDATERTKRLYLGLVSAHNQLRPSLSAQQDEAMHQSISNLMNMSSVNVDIWIDQQNIEKKLKDQIKQVVSLERLPDREFSIDKNYSQKLIKKLRFRGDYDLRVEIAKDSFKEVIKSAEPMIDAEGHKYYKIVIHTKKWEEVTR